MLDKAYATRTRLSTPAERIQRGATGNRPSSTLHLPQDAPMAHLVPVAPQPLPAPTSPHPTGHPIVKRGHGEPCCRSPAETTPRKPSGVATFVCGSARPRLRASTPDGTTPKSDELSHDLASHARAQPRCTPGGLCGTPIAGGRVEGALSRWCREGTRRRSVPRCSTASHHEMRCRKPTTRGDSDPQSTLETCPSSRR